MERPGGWQEDGIYKRIYDIHLINTHNYCSFSDSVTVIFNIPDGGQLGYMWGVENNKIIVYSEIRPGTVQASAGVIYIIYEGTIYFHAI